MLGLTLTYGQCKTQCCWVIRWGWDYNPASDAGSYVDVWLMYDPVLLGHTLGVRLQSTSDAGSYVDVWPMYDPVLLGHTVGVGLQSTSDAGSYVDVWPM
jgi:hypothetical protein